MLVLKIGQRFTKHETVECEAQKGKSVLQVSSVSGSGQGYDEFCCRKITV